MKERRAHPRYPTREYGVLRQLKNGSEVSEQVAWVTNVSAFGLGVQLDRPIQIGAHVTVFAASYSFVGTVVYCRRDSDGFAAGIALSCDTDQANRLLGDAHSRINPTAAGVRG